MLALGQDRPDVSGTAFVAPGAVLIGRVTIGNEASVWYGAVLRADRDTIVVGVRSDVQDGCVLHPDPGVPLSVGTVLAEGQQVPEGVLVAGVPGKVRREVSEAERAAIERNAATCVGLSWLHRRGEA